MKNPPIVNEIKSAIDGRLGREAVIRPVKNQSGLWIMDLSFSHFQKARREERTDYRAGFFYEDKDLWLQTVHSPIMARFLKQNLDFEILLRAIKATAKYRSQHVLIYDGYLDGKKAKGNCIQEDKLSAFLSVLRKIEQQRGFAKSLFPAFPPVGKKRPRTRALTAGNTFYILLAENLKHSDVPKVIKASWPIFNWFYPTKPIFVRNASLNRSMRGIPRHCEIAKIRDLPKTIAVAACDGQIEAAHIKPHQKGGSDRLQNGVWLCNRHHRLTEGRIFGQRSLEQVKVAFL